MKINWKLRLQNKATLVALIALVLSFIYSVLGLLGVIPGISETDLMNTISILVEVLVAIGVVTDPTTSGTSDSTAALDYNSPKTSTAE